MSSRQIVTLACFLAACGPSSSRAPALDPLEDQTAYVAVELSVTLRASDADGDSLSYRVEAQGPADLGDRGKIRPYNDGSTAVFRWTPLASDIGTWTVDFVVSDGGTETRETIIIEVEATTGANRPPAFHRPLGTGTTLELAKTACVDLTLEIEDPDDTDVSLAQKEPVLTGASLDQTSATTGAFRWCPTPAQIAQGDRYTVVFVADDGKNPPQEKPFTIVLRKTQKADCPGEAPVISHAPMDHDSVNPITIEASITDDKGVDASPLFYFSTTDPGETPNLGQMSQLEMTNLAGSTYGADPPNPVASMPAGSEVTLYYVIVAQDKVDVESGCNHLVTAPATGSYKMKVRNPGTAGGLDVCAACTADAQCGDDKDHCITVGSGNFCGAGCGSDSECPSTHQCSATALISINGVSARQCVPKTGTCQAAPPQPTCQDDAREENDTPTAADAKPALVVGQTLTGMKTCPGATANTDDPDWYRLVVPEGEVGLVLDGASTATDLDLHLYDAAGLPVDLSVSAGSDESIHHCVPAGTYYVRVSTYHTRYGENAYSLATSHAEKLCVDVRENDDTRAQATVVTFAGGKWTDTNRTITAFDDDYHKVSLTAGQTLKVKLGFVHTFFGDLDLHLLNSGGTDLTPCDDDNPDLPGTCKVEWGQSVLSPEYLTYAITQSGTYYVVVHGFYGSENRYDICITNNNSCP